MCVCKREEEGAGAWHSRLHFCVLGRIQALSPRTPRPENTPGDGGSIGLAVAKEAGRAESRVNQSPGGGRGLKEEKGGRGGSGSILDPLI